MSRDGSGAELALEPSGFDFSRAYQKALFENGVPLTSLGCDDVQAEYERLTTLGVSFRSPPATSGDVAFAVFDDTCGNLIMLHEE